MRLSEIIRSLRPASFAEKTGAIVAGVTPAGDDVLLPYFQQGWVNIADAQYTVGSPLAIDGGVKTQITINGLGASTNTDYANGLGAGVWSDNKFKPGALGETYTVRLTCNVAQSSSGSGHFVEFEADIGTDQTPFISAAQSIPLNKGQGNATVITISAPFFCLDTFGRNGARLFITPSVDVTLWGAAIFIQRTFKP
jgi:hypothetical protein